MPHWFDIGVNIPDRRLPVEETISSALELDVTGLVSIGTSIAQSVECVALAKQFPHRIVATVGVHPHNAKDTQAGFITQMKHLALQDQVVAIGECGLDFNRNFSPADTQQIVFEQQLQLACELNLPVYLHERDAFETQIALLKRYSDDLSGGVVHCFTGNQQQLEQYLDLGFYIGVTGWVCDPKRGQDLREALHYLPLDRLLLETDSPYLRPKSLKGKSSSNHPANLPHIAEYIANLLQLDLQLLKQASWCNTMAVFGLEARFAD
ncbi:TatD family hydrolase [Aliiglaciecola sp. LCG003]|uniref:TatD family hydrolase n=1 Tax=Aliiglaciecola sp. LCG003 TaxID=3053655 RepID=UPI0025740CB5|nr:TatD family hydrolase [Aliiglaciecola sp. LCG003]WJG09096.1 TatD family hydrolase [Aliiglaciecola sp. LCG003]